MKMPWRPLPAGVLLGAAAVVGLGAVSVGSGPVGCIYPDTCIRVDSPGHDWCSNMANALQWPAGGSIEDAQPVLRPDGAVPRGCHCFNDADNQILLDQVPECRLTDLVDEIEQATRQACQALVSPGYDHNCWTSGGAQPSIVEAPFREGWGSCIGHCQYGNPPAGGSCPDLDPYECATGDGDGGGCALDDETEGTTSGSGLDGDDSEGEGSSLTEAITCDDDGCEVSEAFARKIYGDPSILLTQSPRLVHDAKIHRHVFTGVFPGSLAHAIGLRSGDHLESVNGIVISDLESALEAYVALGAARSLRIRVERDSQWVDRLVTIVP
ncbi:MAG: hypothetical protein KDK70_10550 [Myxococcales bacterium]|nr:hypothetical protein [Myxococcales bacterium]